MNNSLSFSAPGYCTKKYLLKTRNDEGTISWSAHGVLSGGEGSLKSNLKTFDLLEQSLPGNFE